jgi:hypothetical protein
MEAAGAGWGKSGDEGGNPKPAWIAASKANPDKTQK